MVSATDNNIPTHGGARRRLTRDDMHNRNHQIQQRCATTKANGTTGLVSTAHISRIFNSDHPNTPGPGLARKIAAALTEILEREVTMDDVYDYLESELNKSLDWPKARRSDS